MKFLKVLGRTYFRIAKPELFMKVVHRLQKIPVFSPRSKVPYFWSHLKHAAKPATAWGHVAGSPGVLMSLLAAAGLSLPGQLSPALQWLRQTLMQRFGDGR